jgi:hypothetical protein
MGNGAVYKGGASGQPTNPRRKEKTMATFIVPANLFTSDDAAEIGEEIGLRVERKSVPALALVGAVADPEAVWEMAAAIIGDILADRDDSEIVAQAAAERSPEVAEVLASIAEREAALLDKPVRAKRTPAARALPTDEVRDGWDLA